MRYIYNYLQPLVIAINDIKKSYGNEIATLILSCRVFFETGTQDELIAFVADNEINWGNFIYLSKIHKIRPIVYKIIGQLNIPAPIKDFIATEYREVVLQNWKQGAETERIILLLKKSNIEVIPYKGTAFSKQFFGDLISRENSDIDLIIQPDDLPAAIQILKEDGYSPELDDIYQYLGAKYFDYFKDYNFNKFKGDIRHFHVELHWAIAENEVGINAKVNTLLYQANEQIVFFKTNMRGLDPTAHFSAMLIHHSIKDTFKFLKNIIDISQGFRQPSIHASGNLLTNSFTNFELKKALSVSNMLSEQLMGISLPQAPDFNDPENIVKHFRDQVCSQEVFHFKKENMVKFIKNIALLQDSFLQKLKFYWLCGKFRFIPGPTDFSEIQLSEKLFFVYYIMKPFRSVIKPSKR